MSNIIDRLLRTNETLGPQFGTISKMDVASATITLIDAAVKTVQLISELRKHYQEVDGTPRAFQEVLNRLPLMEDTLMQFKDQVKWVQSEKAIADTQRLLRSYETKADELREIFETLAPRSGKSRIERYRLVISRMGKDKKVEVLAVLMMGDLDMLVKNYYMRTTTETRVAKAKEELSLVPESIKDEELEEPGTNVGGSVKISGSSTGYIMQGTRNVFYGNMGKH